MQAQPRNQLAVTVPATWTAVVALILSFSHSCLISYIHPPAEIQFWVLTSVAYSCKERCHRFDSWSEHMPRLWFGPQSGHEQEATDQCFSPSLPPSLPLFQKKNIYIYIC